MIVSVNKPQVTVAKVRTTNPASSNSSGNSNIIYKRYKIKNASLVWTITHNQNTDRYMAVLRDENGDQFNAQVKTISTKIIEVRLTTAIKGFVDVIFDISGSPVIEV
jgi:hypothetical protein